MIGQMPDKEIYGRSVQEFFGSGKVLNRMDTGSRCSLLENKSKTNVIVNRVRTSKACPEDPDFISFISRSALLPIYLYGNPVFSA